MVKHVVKIQVHSDSSTFYPRLKETQTFLGVEPTVP